MFCELSVLFETIIASGLFNCFDLIFSQFTLNFESKTIGIAWNWQCPRVCLECLDTKQLISCFSCLILVFWYRSWIISSEIILTMIVQSTVIQVKQCSEVHYLLFCWLKFLSINTILFSWSMNWRPRFGSSKLIIR